MPGGWELLVIVGVLLLLFGAKRLPEMARSIGQSARVFKGEMKGLKEDGKDAEQPGQPPAGPPPPQASAPPQAPPPQALPPAQSDASPASPSRSEQSS
jgi:sec-independent protein translocase protein TatA